MKKLTYTFTVEIPASLTPEHFPDECKTDEQRALYGMGDENEPPDFEQMEWLMSEGIIRTVGVKVENEDEA